MRARLERESSWATLYLTIARLPSNDYRPIAVPDRGRNFMGATCAAPPELTASRPSCTDEEGSY
jgi:hypothetical protein